MVDFRPTSHWGEIDLKHNSVWEHVQLQDEYNLWRVHVAFQSEYEDNLSPHTMHVVFGEASRSAYTALFRHKE